MSATDLRNNLVFPQVTMAFGGAARVEYTERFAWVTTATGERVRLSRSSLPPVEKWTAFLLGDAAAMKARKAGAA